MGQIFQALDRLSGDVGQGITCGQNRHIIWNFGSEHSDTYSSATQVRINAIPNCAILVDERDGQIL